MPVRNHVHIVIVALTTALLGWMPARSTLGQPPDADSEQPGKRTAALNIGGTDTRDGGMISGMVLFKGVKPQAKPIVEIAGNSFCKQCYPDPDQIPRHDDVVFGRNGDNDTLQNVLVYVSKGLEGKHFDPPSKSAVLDQVGCMYAPHVIAVMVGQTLDIRNSDATLHNVMTTPRNNPPFNVGMPSQDQVIQKVFRHPEFKMNLRCFMHPWMSAYVHVLEHPFFALTQSDGTFSLKGLPPGEYEITVLHESGLFEPTPATISVTLGAGQTRKIEFTYRPKRDAKPAKP